MKKVHCWLSVGMRCGYWMDGWVGVVDIVEWGGR